MKLEYRTETEILNQITRAKNRLIELYNIASTKATREEERRLNTRIAELWREHYAFYGNW